MQRAPDRPSGDGLLRLGSRLSRETALYASSSIATFVFAIVGVAVLTRFMTIQEYGHLALFYLFAAFLTIAINLGTLQGTFTTVFRAGAEEGLEFDDEEPSSTEPRSALTTGLAITAAVAALATCAVVALTGPLLTLVQGSDEGGRDALILAAFAGGLGSLWRFAHNVLRFERRALLFSGLGAMRAALVVALSAALVVAGYGINGAIVGTAAANACATFVALAATRRSYGRSLSRGAAASILRRGVHTIPFVAAVWVVHNVDLYLVSVYLSDADVARYRVAARIGAGMSYFVSAFLLAWGPLRGTTLYAAVVQRGDLRAAVVTYFVLAASWITLGLVILADVLIRIAPQGYERAAPVIPLVAMGFVAFGLFVLLQQLGQFEPKRRRFVQLSLVAVVVFLGSAILLIDALGVYGAPLAQILAFGLAAAVVLVLGQRGPEPIAFEPGRLLRATAVTLACVGLTAAVTPQLGGARLIVDLLIVAAFPLLLITAGAVRRNEARAVLAVLPTLRGAASRRYGLISALRSQPPIRGRAVELLVHERRSPAYAAEALATTEDVVFSEATRALRAVSGSAGDTEMDAAIGAYLFERRPMAERDRLARRLWSRGADPEEVETMESTLRTLQRLSRRRWRGVTRGARDAEHDAVG